MLGILDTREMYSVNGENVTGFINSYSDLLFLEKDSYVINAQHSDHLFFITFTVFIIDL